MERQTRAFLDRVEGDKAVLLLGEHQKDAVVLPLRYLPTGSREGMVFTLIVRFEPQLTEESRREISGLIDSMAEETR